MFLYLDIFMSTCSWIKTLIYVHKPTFTFCHALTYSHVVAKCHSFCFMFYKVSFPARD